jgi:DNA-binding transcriptional ArsR family regulator
VVLIERFCTQRLCGNIITAGVLPKEGSIRNPNDHDMQSFISSTFDSSLDIFRQLRITVLSLSSSDGQLSVANSNARYMKRLLWYLLGGTRGGPNRAEIIRILRDRPCNANQLAEILGVDYKTVQHHVKVLGEHELVAKNEKGSYGAVLFLTPKMEDALPIMEEIWSKIGRSNINKTRQE